MEPLLKKSEGDCLCKDERAFEHAVRKIAGRIIHDRRRFLLADFQGYILEGNVQFEEHGGVVKARVDYADVAELLKHHYPEGSRVRLMVLPAEEYSVLGAQE